MRVGDFRPWLFVCAFAWGCTSTAASTTTVLEDDTGVATDGTDQDAVDQDATDLDAAEDVTATTGCHGLGCGCGAGSDCTSGFCAKGQCVACVPASPPIETCNGRDDDCDGQVDEATCPWPSDCVQAACDGKAGKCVQKPLDAIGCSDGNACTLDDRCQAGICVPGGLRACDDQAVCTTDSCVAASGCVFTPVDATCTDDNGCTLQDHCALGSCVGKAKVCNDANPCTTDACAPLDGSCLAIANTATCDDGDPCILGDHCSGGACVGVPLQCDDKNPCTDDACVPGQGCVHVPNGKQPPDCT
jgi:hypothetical protein